MGEPPAQPPTDAEVGEPRGAEPREIRATIPERQEHARQYLAFALVGIFGLEVLGSMLALWFCVRADLLQNLKDILTLILGPTVALVGSATGFYFATAPGSSNAPPASPTPVPVSSTINRP
jgi:hypothetical protein